MNAASAAEVRLLVNLLEQPSPSGREKGAAECLVGWFADCGMAADRDRVGNVTVAWGGGRKTLCMLGHIDTVPGTLPVSRRGGIVTGRGAVDAKGPLAAFSCALARVARKMEEPEGVRVLLVGAVGEEADSHGARHLLKGLLRPSATIIGEPSGWSRVTLGYRGSLRGTYLVRLPAAHTAARGPTAPEEAVQVWWRIISDAEQYNARTGDNLSAFHSLSPRLVKVSSREDGLAGEAAVGFGVRIPPELNTDQVKGRLEQIVSPHPLRFEGGEEPFTAERNSSLVRGLLREIRATGGAPRFTVKTGTSDMNVVGPVWGTPIAAYGPGDPALSHTPDERISLDEFARSIAVLERFLTRWLKDDACG